MQWYTKFQGLPVPATHKVVEELLGLIQAHQDSSELVAILDAQIANIHQTVPEYDQNRGLAIKASGRFDKVKKSGSSVVTFETIDLAL